MTGRAIGGIGAIMGSTAGVSQFMHNTLWLAGQFPAIMAME
jgi:hypothetical protein